MFETELDWARLPRMRTAIGALFALIADHGAGVAIGGADTADLLFARTRTLAQLYARTHYGGCMPLLYGYPADLHAVTVYSFAARAPAGWEPTLNEEHDEYRWSTVEEAVSLLHWPEARDAVRRLATRLAARPSSRP